MFRERKGRRVKTGQAQRPIRPCTVREKGEVVRHMPIAKSLALLYRGQGRLGDDAFGVAYLGLIAGVQSLAERPLSGKFKLQDRLFSYVGWELKNAVKAKYHRRRKSEAEWGDPVCDHPLGKGPVDHRGDRLEEVEESRFLLGLLDERERDLVRGYFFDGYTFVELAERTVLHRCTCRGIVEGALDSMRVACYVTEQRIKAFTRA